MLRAIAEPRSSATQRPPGGPLEWASTPPNDTACVSFDFFSKKNTVFERPYMVSVGVYGRIPTATAPRFINVPRSRWGDHILKSFFRGVSRGPVLYLAMLGVFLGGQLGGVQGTPKTYLGASGVTLNIFGVPKHVFVVPWAPPS